MQRNTALSLLYIVTLALVVGGLWLAAPSAKPTCKVQVVEVTKTEGNLTWVDVEQVCL